jgi:hypothetical protein
MKQRRLEKTPGEEEFRILTNKKILKHNRKNFFVGKYRVSVP